MGMNFPNSPLPGQVYTPVGGYSYVFLDGVWRIVQDAQSIGTADTRNRIVNGAMQISQEYGIGSGVSTTGAYAVDQWSMQFTAPAVINTRQYIDPAFSSNSYRYRVSVTTADTALAGSDNCYIMQPLEGSKIIDFGYGQSYAKQAILRFGFRGPAGTYVARIGNFDHTRTWLAPFTISAEEANIDTTQTFVVPGDVTGTWPTDTSGSMRLCIVLATSPTLYGVAGWQAGSAWGLPGMSNGIGVAAAVYHLFDVGLYLDPLATGVPPRWQMPDEAEELRACQRYWYEGPATVATNKLYAGSAGGFATLAQFTLLATMRTTPTATVGTASSYGNCTFYGVAANNTSYIHRVDVPAAGWFTGQSGSFKFNARM